MATLLIGLLVALLLRFTGFASGACDGMAGALVLLGDTTRLITGILYLKEKRRNIVCRSKGSTVVKTELFLPTNVALVQILASTPYMG